MAKTKRNQPSSTTVKKNTTHNVVAFVAKDILLPLAINVAATYLKLH